MSAVSIGPSSSTSFYSSQKFKNPESSLESQNELAPMLDCDEVYKLNRSLLRHQDPPKHKDRIFRFISKYPNGNQRYVNEYQEKGVGRPQLLTLVSIGNNSQEFFPGSTFKTLTPKIIAQGFEIVKLMPDTKNCNMGSLFHNKEMTPLAVACHNHNFPVEHIQRLIEMGCDHKAKVMLLGKPVSIIESLSGWCRTVAIWATEEMKVKIEKTLARAKAIQAIFDEFDKKNDQKHSRQHEKKFDYDQ